MTTPENLSAEYVKRILKSIDPDLATLIVFSCVSLNPNILLKILVVATDVSYYRNMKHEMEKGGDGKNELTPAEIASLLKSDGWIL